MTQSQFLLLIIAIIPPLNCLSIRLYKNAPLLLNFVNKFLPILFFANLIGLYSSLENEPSFLIVMETLDFVSLGFIADKMALTFLCCLNFFWIIFAFYAQRFLQMNSLKNSNNLQLFFTATIAFLTLIIISKNLITTLLFYNCLIFLCYFFAVNFLHKSEAKLSRLFMFSLYLESVFFFLGTVAAYKFNGQIDFLVGNSAQNVLLLFFFFTGLFLSILIPFYLIYRANLNLEPLVLYVFFFLAYAFSSLCIFIRLLAFIFGFKEFSLLIAHVGFGFFESIFLLNIIISSVFLVFSKGIKSSFFYLFFQQFNFALFAIFFFATFDATSINLALYSFCLEFTLVFLAISNLVLYLTKAENKKLEGLFYRLIITCSLLAFAFADMLGIAPGLGALEKLFIIKIILQKKLWLSAIILFVNCCGLILFFCKIFLPMLVRSEEKRSEEDINLVKNIDFDSSLILTGLVVATLIFLGLIIFPFFNYL